MAEKLYQNEAFLRELLLEGKTTAEIAGACSCSLSTIRVWLVKLNLDVESIKSVERRLKHLRDSKLVPSRYIPRNPLDYHGRWPLWMPLQNTK